VRFVAFTNEEEPFFWTDEMGSSMYARSAKARGERIVAMLSLEAMGYYDDTPGSQHYPLCLDRLFVDWWGYPGTGNFLAFVGEPSARDLVCRAQRAFSLIDFPFEGVVGHPRLGIGWSDHWSFTRAGYPAIMVTATAPQRNPCYHKGCDRPGLLSYDRLARVVVGLAAVIEALADPAHDQSCAAGAGSTQ
jgi:Zn-dependent M28 family amino/carboxypeptidase